MRVLWVMVPLAAVVLWGCSVTARDRLAHFFFEVPAAPDGTGGDAPTDASKDEPAELKLPPPRFVSIHPPYRQRTCGACHDVGRRMQVYEDLPGACKACHADYFSDRVGHFPVAEGQCMQCHDPHRSTNRALLIADILDTCVQCHDEPEDLSEEAHGGDGVENCVKCHDAHFGVSPLLKAEVVKPGDN